MQYPTLPSSRGQYAGVIRTPNDDGSPRSDACRQQIVQCALLEQGVTAREQNHIQVHMLHGFEADRGLVHTEAEGLDRTAAAQLFQGTKAAAFDQLTERCLVTIAMGQAADV